MAFTMSRGSPGTPPHTPRHGLPVSWHAVVPDYPFRAGSAIRSRDISSRLCPLRGRYTSAPHGAPTTTRPPSPKDSRPVGDPAFVPVVRVERNVGGQLISLNALTGHRPMPRRLRRQICDTNAGHGTGSDVFPVDVGLHRLEIWLRAIQLSPYSAGPTAPRSQRLERPLLSWHALVPQDPFEPEVSHQTQEPPSEFLPAALGIQ